MGKEKYIFWNKQKKVLHLANFFTVWFNRRQLFVCVCNLLLHLIFVFFFVKNKKKIVQTYSQKKQK